MEQSDEFCMIDAYDVRVTNTFDGDPMHRVPFRVDWLRRITETPAEHLAVLYAHGDNMYPTLEDGGILLLDRSERTAGRQGIYVLGPHGALNIRRISTNEVTKSLYVGSDNEAYGGYHAGESDDLGIAGRVIWIGRKV